MSNAGYPEPPRVGSEADTLLGSLERMRATFHYKCADLDAATLATRLPSSDLTLGRLLKHAAYMEDINFTRDLAGHPVPEPWASAPADERSAWVFTSADDDSAADLYAVWTAAVERSRNACEQFLTEHDPGDTYTIGDVSLSLRRLLVDMIEEYGRHTGHADLLREHIDGRVGEDPPGRPYPFRRP